MVFVSVVIVMILNLAFLYSRYIQKRRRWLYYNRRDEAQRVGREIDNLLVSKINSLIYLSAVQMALLKTKSTWRLQLGRLKKLKKANRHGSVLEMQITSDSPMI